MAVNLTYGHLCGIRIHADIEKQNLFYQREITVFKYLLIAGPVAETLLAGTEK
jgi:hypothetical protein